MHRDLGLPAATADDLPPSRALRALVNVPYWLASASCEALRLALGEPDALAAADVDRVADAVALAWHLRQRDTAAAARWLPWLREAVAGWAPSAEREAAVARLDLIDGELRWLDGDLDGARGIAQTLLAHVGDAPSLLRHDALTLLGHELWERGRLADFSATQREAEQMAQGAGDELRRRTARLAQARATLYRASDAGDFRERWADALAFADDPHPAISGEVMVLQGHLATRARDTRRALALTMEAAAQLEAGGNLRNAAIAELSVAVYLAYLGDATAALDQGLQTVARLRPLGWPIPLGLALSNLGAYYGTLGRGDEALAALDEAAAVLRRHPESFEAVSVPAERARVHQLRGEHDAALACVREVEAQVADGRFRVHAGRALTVQAQVLAARGEPQAALDLLTQLLDWSDGDLLLPRRAAVLEAAADIHRHHTELPGPPGQSAPTAEIHYLQARVALAGDGEAEYLPHEALERLSDAWAALGEPVRALECSRRALAAWRRQHDQASAHRAVVTEVRLRTAQAQAEARRLAQAAEAASRRAEALADLGTLLRRLSDVGRELTMHRQLDQLVPLLKERLQALMPVQSLLLMEMDADGQGLHLAAGRSEGRDLPALSVRLDDAESLVARCAREGRLLRTPQDAPFARRVPGTTEMHSALFVPLLIDDRLVGVLSVQSAQETAYGERALEVMGPLASYVAIALDNAHAYDRLDATVQALRAAQTDLEAQKAALEVASLTDSLTGLWNRRYVQQRVVAEAHRLRAEHERRPEAETPEMLLLLVDLDHFKHLNDLHGHTAGDVVLQQVAQRLRALSRPDDHVVRWGGEEFLLVASRAGRDQLAALAERVREAVAREPFDIGRAAPLALTCSVGAVAYPLWRPIDGALPAMPSWDVVIELADRALYMAKREGRNRWTLAELAEDSDRAGAPGGPLPPVRWRTGGDA